MKCKIVSIISIILCISLIVCSTVSFAFAAESTSTKGSAHRGNIVFVTDESGSMKNTDPDNDRYEAIRLFLGEMTNTGNYVGSVSFGEDIVDSIDIQEIKGQSQKDSIMDDISDQKYSNYTNIGLGLLKAVELLDNGKNEDLDSSIILLTDGNTDMSTKEEIQESYELKADAIEQARKNGYKIYTICLNVNGAADSSELKQIAQATGGEFAEVNSSKGLNEVETMLHKIIFNSFEDGDGSGLTLKFGTDGSVTANFDVPEIGIEEINVLFEGKLTSCVLTDPEGNATSSDDRDAIIVQSSGFLLQKIEDPVGGSWTATAYGDPNASIQLRLLFNSDFSVTLKLQNADDVHLGSTVDIVAQLYEGNDVIENLSRYKGVSCNAVVEMSRNVQSRNSLNPLKL